MLDQQNLPPEVRAKNFVIPKAYHRIVELGLINLDPWYLLDDQEFKIIYEGIRKRYPNYLVLPFARRRDNDDVGVLVVDSGEFVPGQVLVIHDYASPGSEVEISLSSFWDWFRLAVDEMIQNSID